MTCLQGASLKEAKNPNSNQLYEVKTFYKVKLDESLRLLLIEKYPTLLLHEISGCVAKNLKICKSINNE